MKENPLRPVILLFVVLTGLFVACKTQLLRWGIDNEVLIIGNLTLFLVTFLSYRITKKGINSDNPQAAVRAMYGSFMVKLFICVLVAMVYILTEKKHVNKPALFICMGLYLVYSFLEVSILSKMTKKKKNG